MQERHILDAAPIATVERVPADQIERARDRTAIALGKKQQHLVRHSLAEQREEGARKIGLSPFARAGILIEYPERVPIGLGELGASDMPYRQAIERRGAFLADRLALAGGERAEEIVEAGIAAIAPVELDAAAD